MNNILALQMTDAPDTDTTEGEEDLPTSTFSITCTIPNDPA